MNKLLVVVFISLFGLLAAAEIQVTSHISDVFRRAVKEGKKYGSENVLIVFDIDNTLLALDQNLGSVHWFRWQSELIEGNGNENRVAKTIPGLMEKQSWIYQMSSTHTPERQTVEVVSQLKKMGFPVMILSSRTPEMRGFTERELKRNGILPLPNYPGPESGYAGEQMYGGRPVSYQNGVYLTSGLNKGEMLKALLEKARAQVDYLIFVDDEEKHVHRMEAAFKDVTPVTSFRYSNLDAEVEKFNNGNKRREIDLWNGLNRVREQF